MYLSLRKILLEMYRHDNVRVLPLSYLKRDFEDSVDSSIETENLFLLFHSNSLLDDAFLCQLTVYFLLH